MAGLSNAAMVVGANAIKGVLLYAQLHSAAAGSAGTANVTAAPRVAVTWTSVTGNGDFHLAASLNFTGGASNGNVYSVTLWPASTSGTFYGEFILAGDTTFDSSGAYTVTALAFDGSAS